MALSRSKCNWVEFSRPVSDKVKRARREEEFGWASPI
jgi:hypothetical protein